MQRYVEALSSAMPLLLKWNSSSLMGCLVMSSGSRSGLYAPQDEHPLRRSPEVDDQKLPYWLWNITYTAVFNLTGNPAVVLPHTVLWSTRAYWLVGAGRHATLEQQSSSSNWLFQRPPGTEKTTGTGGNRGVAFRRELHILSVYQLVADLTCNCLRLIL